MSFFNPFKQSQENKGKSPTSKKPVGKAAELPDEARSARAATVRLSDSKKGGERFASVLKKPRVTEKASYVTEDGAYTFEVLPEASKQEIAKAIKEAYGVTPLKVRTLPIRSKQVYFRGRARGASRGGKKAVIYLKKGERIEFI